MAAPYHLLGSHCSWTANPGYGLATECGLSDLPGVPGSDLPRRQTRNTQQCMFPSVSHTDPERLTNILESMLSKFHFHFVKVDRIRFGRTCDTSVVQAASRCGIMFRTEHGRGITLSQFPPRLEDCTTQHATEVNILTRKIERKPTCELLRMESGGNGRLKK